MPMKGHSGGITRCFTLILAIAFGTIGCSKMGMLKAMKAFKEANAAYQQQDYRKSADLYEQTVSAGDFPELASAYGEFMAG